MASGKTLELKEFDRLQQWRARKPRRDVVRDRSLRGKARVRARKQSNKNSPVTQPTIEGDSDE